MALTRPRAAQIYDIDYKQATRVVTVASITLGGGAPNQVDGVNLSLNDRVLVTGQSTASENGIYYVTTLGSGSNGTWSRSLDTNATGELLSGTIVMVTEGLIYADTQWKITTDDPITVGVTAQTWVQNYSANSISSGNSNVVVLSNANVLISSAGTANVVDVFGTGITITGTESVTGNVTAGNILTAGLVSAAGNITGNYFAGNVLQLNASVTPIVAATGQAFWDTDEHTVTLGMENGVQQQIGLENYMYVKASAAITNGQAVMFTGANGTNILAAPADTTSVGFRPEYIIGVATQDIALNAFGYITVYGLVHALNTNGWNVGDILWVDNATPGALTNVQPSDPNFQIQMAAVTKKSAGDGHIMVRPTPFYDIDRITNVLTTSPTTGQSLVYDGANSIWINGTAASANTAGTVTTNAQPNITSVGTLTSLSVTGNITGDYFLGNVFYANGITASKIYSGNSEVNVVASGGNVNVSIGGTSNVAVFTTDGEYVTGLVSATGNVTGSNVLTGGIVSATGNATAGNILTAGVVSATGNIVGGNISTAGLISATGNVTGNYLFGNAVSVTGVNTFSSIAVSGANTLVANTISTELTVAAGNNIVLTTDDSTNTLTIAYSSLGSSIFATGGDMGLISQPVTASEDLGSVVDLADTSYDLGTLFISNTFNQIDMTGFTSNINTGNLNAVGLISAAGNVYGANVITAGLQYITPNYITVSANGTSNLSATTTTNILLINATGLTATLNMPDSAGNGQICSIAVSGNTVTLAVGTGTVNSTFAGSATVGTTFKYVYNTGTTTWYRIV